MCNANRMMCCRLLIPYTVTWFVIATAAWGATSSRRRTGAGRAASAARCAAALAEHAASASCANYAPEDRGLALSGRRDARPAGGRQSSFSPASKAEPSTQGRAAHKAEQHGLSWGNPERLAAEASYESPMRALAAHRPAPHVATASCQPRSMQSRALAAMQR